MRTKYTFVGLLAGSFASPAALFSSSLLRPTHAAMYCPSLASGWMLWCRVLAGWGLLAIALALAGRADAQPVKRPAQTRKAPAPLPPAQLEEALRLLLKADSVSRHRTGTEAAGLVLDQALTKPGHDFYDLFYNGFEAPAGVADFTVQVGERPGRGNSSLIVLTVNDQELFEAPLPTRLDQMEELVAGAVEAAQGYLVEAQNVSRQLESGRHAPLEVY